MLSDPEASGSKLILSRPTRRAERYSRPRQTRHGAFSLNVQGTPTFILNGKEAKIEPGTLTWTQLEKQIKDALGA